MSTFQAESASHVYGRQTIPIVFNPASACASREGTSHLRLAEGNLSVPDGYRGFDLLAVCGSITTALLIQGRRRRVGLISGLVLDVYYANIALLLVPFVESLQGYWRAWRTPRHDWKAISRLFEVNLLYCFTTLVAFSPTLITRQIIYGHPLSFGYGDVDIGLWASPRLLTVLFSSDHGVLVWTPIVIPAVVGLFLFLKQDRPMAACRHHLQYWPSTALSLSTRVGTGFPLLGSVLHFTHSYRYPGFGRFP